MKPGKIFSVAADFVKGGYRFGYYLSDSVLAKMGVSPKKALVAGGAFDALAGVGITLYAGNAAINTGLLAASAVAGAVTAPVHALVTVPVAAVFLALELGLAGIGIGLLDAARTKAGIRTPGFIARGARKTKNVAEDGAHKASKGIRHGLGATAGVFKKGAKGVSWPFRKVAGLKKNNTPPPAKPKLDNNFKI